MKRLSARGFTLLETVVAMAILSLALMAIFDLNAGAVRMHAYTKKLTVATLLARSKMTDLEQKLYDDGMSADDEEDDGDFSEEGWPSFKWRAKIIAPKTDNLPPEQLLAAVFNIPMGGGDDSGNGDGTTDPLSAIAGMFGGGAGANGAQGAAGGMAGMLGPMAGLAQGQFTQLVDTLTKSVREVHLTVYWKDGKEIESIDVVTHVVSMGPGSDRNGGAANGINGGNSGLPPQLQNMTVDAQTGMPCTNSQSPTGGSCITIQQWLATHNNQPPPGLASMLSPAQLQAFLASMGVAPGGAAGGGGGIPNFPNGVPNRPPMGPLTSPLRSGAGQFQPKGLLR